MRGSRARSAFAARSRRPSVLFDIDEDSESNRSDSPSEVMSTLYCSPETRARRDRSDAPPASRSVSVLRRTFTGMEDGSVRDTAVDLHASSAQTAAQQQQKQQQQAQQQQQQQQPQESGYGGLGASLYSQALSNSKLDAPSSHPQPAAALASVEMPQGDAGALDFQRQEDARPGPAPGGARRPRKRSRARSRKQSIYSTWSYCGVGFSNAVLRLLTGLAVAPAVVCALLFAPPALAVATLTVAVLCLCAYEYAWLAHRIHYQLLATYDWYESRSRPPSPSPSDCDPFGRPESDRGVVCSASASARGPSRRQHHGNRSADGSHFQSFASGYTQSTSSSLSHGDADEYASRWRGGDDDRESFADPLADAEAAAMGAARPKAPSPLELLDLDPSQQVGVIGVLTARVRALRGREWLARCLVAAVVTAAWSLGSTLLVARMPFPVQATPPVLDAFPYYFWLSNLAAALCAVSTPTLPLAAALVVQKACFQVLLQNALNCPRTAATTAYPLACAQAPVTSMQTFAIGALALVLLRSASARSAADLVLGVALDLLGYTYLTGTLSLLASMVYPSSAPLLPLADAAAGGAAPLFPRMWLVMLAVVWGSELVAYACDAVMFHFRLRHCRLLPARLEFTFDVEAAAAAVAAGALVMVGACELLDVPGGLLPKLCFSAAGVFLGRFGRLLVSLIKKAAGVRWSGRLAPGFGGVMDATNSLLVTSVVFVKYYLYAITLATGDDAAGASGFGGGSGSGSGGEGAATSVNFSSAVAASLLGE